MIEKLSNTHQKDLVKLKNKKYRKLNGKVLVEGTRLIKQLSDYKIKFEELIVEGEHSKTAHQYSAEKLYEATEEQLRRIASTKTPQNIAAVVKTRSIKITDTKFLLYLDEISDPGNLGAIFRTAAAADISGIILSPGCCDIYNPKVIRASLGAVFYLPSEIHEFAWLQEHRSTIVSTSLKGTEKLFNLEKPDILTLVIGSEAFGVNRKILEISDHQVKIPISGNIESLNAAVAAGIAIYHFVDK